MAMVVWVGAGMEVVDDMHAGQTQGDWLLVRGCRSISRVRGDEIMTPNHTTIQVRSSG